MPRTNPIKRNDRLVFAWAVALALLIAVPWLRSGYLLSYDMVWVPDPALDRPGLWGLGSALPRAVPSDGVIALLSSIIPAAVLQRVVLVGALVAGAVGAGRLVGSLPLVARLAAVSFFIFNPFVAERLLIGHWPLLVGYAALPWLIVATRSDHPRWASIVLALAALAMSPSGGVLGAVTVAVMLWGKGAARGLGIAAAVNAPWIVAGLLNASSGRTDPQGVAVFAAQSEGPLGHLGTLLSLGGIWNSEVVLPSRGFVTTTVMVVVLWIVMAVGLRAARAATVDFDRLVVLGVVGLAVAALGWITPDLLVWLVESVPGAGLLRDGTRFLALLAPVFVVLLGHGAARIVEKTPTGLPAVTASFILVALPLSAIPDLSLGLGGRLTPASYPDEWATMSAQIDQSNTEGDLLILPFTVYRAPVWNDNRPVLDPAGKFFGRETVVADDLLVSDRLVEGEGTRSRAVDEAIEVGDLGKLRVQGVSLMLYDRSAPVDRASLALVDDLESVATQGSLELYELGSAESPHVGTTRRVLISSGWILAALVVAAAIAARIIQARQRPSPAN